MQQMIYIPDRDRKILDRLKDECKKKGLSISGYLWGLHGKKIVEVAKAPAVTDASVKKGKVTPKASSGAVFNPQPKHKDQKRTGE